MRTLLAALLLAGCATATPVPGPDGTTHYVVNCRRSMVYCYRRAAEACPAGYDIVETGPLLIKCKQQALSSAP